MVDFGLFLGGGGLFISTHANLIIKSICRLNCIIYFYNVHKVLGNLKLPDHGSLGLHSIKLLPVTNPWTYGVRWLPFLLFFNNHSTILKNFFFRKFVEKELHTYYLYTIYYIIYIYNHHILNGYKLSVLFFRSYYYYLVFITITSYY